MACRFAFLFALPLVAGIGAPAAAQTLPQALAAAYWNNPEVNAARAQTRAVDEGVPLAKSGNRPRVSAFTSMTAQASRQTSASRTTSDERIDATYGLAVEQDIFRGFRTRNEIREAEAAVLASRHTLANTIQNVLFDAAQAYMDVLRDQAVLQLRQRNVEFLEEQVQAALDRFEVGEVTRTDVAQTRARLAEGQANVSLAQANLRASMATFRQVVGQEVRSLSPGFVFGNLLPNSLQAAISTGQAGHPAILAAIYAADADAFEVKQVEGEFLPRVSIEGTAQRTFGIDNRDERTVGTVTGRVSIPIYQGGATHARLRQAKERLGESRIAIDIRREQVRAAVVAAWYRLEAATAAIAAATTAVEAAQVALEGIQEELRVGQRTTLDVLDAQQELLDARVTLVLAQRDRVVSSFAILSAMGYLTAERLNLPTARYGFGWGRIWLFRRLLHQLFLWRLKLENPQVVVLGLDTMVMDNDEALVRQGCQPTYKKVKGFQPLQLTWGPFVVDALFRGGKKNGNAGDTAGKFVEHTVSFLRRKYRENVAIIVRMDAGFFDQKLFRTFEELGIGYVCSGKLQDDVVELARAADPSQWKAYDNGRQLWQYFEFGIRLKAWPKTEWRRAFYTRPAYEDEQRLLEFARPDTVIYTNLGQGGMIDARLEAARRVDLTRPDHVIELHHGRGRDELVHRALKDFRAEQLPFKSFQANAAFYYTVLVGFFLFETSKEDVTAEVVPVTAQATRVRREAIDFAAKIVRHAGETILKVTAAVWDRLGVPDLWERAANPPPLACV